MFIMIYPVVPLKAEYSLTDKGKSLIPILESLYSWGKEYKSFIENELEDQNEQAASLD